MNTGWGCTVLLVTVWGVGEHRVGVYSIASDCVGGTILQVTVWGVQYC